jgi:hypothetical protein
VAFFVDPTPGETEADRNARINFYKRGSGTVSGMILYIYTENNTRCTALRYSDVSFINGQYRFVLVDFDGSGVPLYVWVNNDTDIINTGAWVMSGRPYHTTRDMCCAILPNGDMLYHSAVAGGDRADDWANRSSVYTFDGSSITEVQDSPVGLRTDTRMMPLPDGSILYFDAGAFYTDAGYKGPARRYIPTQSQAIPFPNSRPVISSFPYRLEPGQSATLFGVQLNGLHEGMAEGDDYASRTNFPLVRLTNKFNGNVHYCRTYGYSYRGIQPNRASQCSVEIPNWVPIGDYSMEVVANGVPSTPRDITIKFDSGSGSFMNRYS